MKKKLAVLLCGSGFKDGSEIREAVGTLYALSQQAVDHEIFALDEPQFDVVNCLTGETAPGEKRNQLVEAARIAREKIKPLSALRVAEFSGLVIPGGFGAAKNLCSFAREGSKGTVQPLVEKVLREFSQAGKPIGAICIAPAIVALTFKGQGFELTLGAAGEASAEIEKLGHRHFVKAAHEAHVDRKHKVVTTPAYMYDEAPLHDIFAGIHSLVKEVIALA